MTGKCRMFESTRNIAELANHAKELADDANSLLKKLDCKNRYDLRIEESARHIRDKMLEFLRFKEILSSPYHFLNLPSKQHDLDLIQAINTVDEVNFNTSASPLVFNWRKSISKKTYSEIPESDRKEIFDYFFRDDLYGRLYRQDINMLSRGVNEPAYFLPPAAIKLAIDVANDNSWFGYSDSLGHRDTRQSIARLESLRRKIKIKPENTAVIQGNTSGLNAVLSMLARENNSYCRKRCILIMPTYAPIADNVWQYFDIIRLNLSFDYKINYDNLYNLLDKDVQAILLSVPHNPFLHPYSAEELADLCTRCQKIGANIIFDEIIFDHKISPCLNPITFPNLIVLSSYSKKYNIPGLKLGHMLASKDFISRFYRHASTTYGSPPSFLYFTATIINNFEYCYSTNGSEIYQELRGKTSRPKLIMKDFALWSRFMRFHNLYQICLIENYLDRAITIGIESVFGLNDPSPNCIVRFNANDSAYRLSLELLSRTLTSVMPIECFLPSTDFPQMDLRVTIACNPFSLNQGIASLVWFAGEAYLRSHKELWLREDDAKWLEVVGKLDSAKKPHGWGESYRSCSRLKNIYHYAGCDLDQNLLRAVSLIACWNVWKNSSERISLYKEITGEDYAKNSESLAEMALCLLNRPGKLKTLPELLNGFIRCIVNTLLSVVNL